MSGQANMDMDEALLEGFPTGGGPILRFYQWDRPTLSLGYFQKAEEVADLAYCASKGVPVVRRPTGGGAILHHLEFTLSLFLPLNHPLLACTLPESYLVISRPVAEVLRGLGAAVSFRGEASKDKHAANCFAGQACPDLVHQGRKIFGSAQRRKNGAMLFHGSLLLGLDKELWQGVFGQRLGQGFSCLADILDRPVEFSQLREPLAKAYENLLGQALILDKNPVPC
jgi:lipoate-protein ligase A